MAHLNFSDTYEYVTQNAAMFIKCSFFIHSTTPYIYPKLDS